MAADRLAHVAVEAHLALGLGDMSRIDVIVGAGSDTTFWIMSGSLVTQGTAPAHALGGVSDHYNASQTAVKTYEMDELAAAPSMP